MSFHVVCQANSVAAVCSEHWCLLGRQKNVVDLQVPACLIQDFPTGSVTSPSPTCPTPDSFLRVVQGALFGLLPSLTHWYVSVVQMTVFSHFLVTCVLCWYRNHSHFQHLNLATVFAMVKIKLALSPYKAQQLIHWQIKDNHVCALK